MKNLNVSVNYDGIGMNKADGKLKVSFSGLKLTAAKTSIDEVNKVTINDVNGTINIGELAAELDSNIKLGELAKVYAALKSNMNRDGGLTVALGRQDSPFNGEYDINAAVSCKDVYVKVDRDGYDHWHNNADGSCQKVIESGKEHLEMSLEGAEIEGRLGEVVSAVLDVFAEFKDDENHSKTPFIAHDGSEWTNEKEYFQYCRAKQKGLKKGFIKDDDFASEVESCRE